MSIKLLKKELKKHGKEYYEKIAADHKRSIELEQNQKFTLRAASFNEGNK